VVFAALIALTLRRGVKDPVCDMTVDKHANGPTSEYDARTFFFCGAHCKHTFDDDPARYARRS
jgi:P-type Cu+ transporter